MRFNGLESIEIHSIVPMIVIPLRAAAGGRPYISLSTKISPPGVDVF